MYKPQVPSLEEARALFPDEEANQAEFEKIGYAYRSMAFSETIRQTGIACFLKCGGRPHYMQDHWIRPELL